MNNDIAYAIGFIQTDGHMRKSTRNRGSMSIEIAARDKDILPKIGALFTDNYHISHRTRDTNFANNYTCYSLKIFDLKVRQRIEALGVPYGKKSSIIAPPLGLEYSLHYWRGVIDGDGSLGFKPSEKSIPFISLITTSEAMKEGYIEFAEWITGKTRNLNRNKRDNCYNIIYQGLDAQKLVKKLYPEGCLALNRKTAKAKKILAWLP